MMKMCAGCDCDEERTKACSSCLKEHYCSAERQKREWRSHKIICHLIRQMPDKLVPIKTFYVVLENALNQTEAQKNQEGREKLITLLELTAKFAERQCGKRNIENSLYVRDYDYSMDTRIVDIETLCPIYKKLRYYILSGQLLSACNLEKAFPHLKSLMTIYMNVGCNLYS
jgi:hypothetical protein